MKTEEQEGTREEARTGTGYEAREEMEMGMWESKNLAECPMRLAGLD